MRPSRLLLGALVFLGVVLVAADLILGSLSFERLRPILERQLSQGFGLEVRLAGDLELRLLPRPHFEASRITVANLPLRPSPHLLEIGLVKLDFQLWPLLRSKVAIDSIEIYDAELRIEPDEAGRFTFSPDVEELDEQTADPDAGALELHIASLRVENLRVFYDRAGEEDVTTLVLDVLQLEADELTGPVSVTVAGDYEGGRFELEARVGSLVELLEPTRPYPVELRGRVLESELEVEGTLDVPTQGTGVDLRFSVRLDDLAALASDPDRRLPDLGPLHASGRLRDPEGRLGVESLVIRTELDQPVLIVVEGSVRDLIAMQGVDLQLRVEADGTDFFEALAGTPLPDMPFSASVHLSDDDGSLGAEGEAQAGRDGPLSLDLKGVYDDLRRFAELDVSVRLSSADLNAIPKALELELDLPLPTLGPIELSASLRDYDGSFGLADIRAVGGSRDDTWVEVTGAVRDLLEIQGVSLDGRFGAANVQALAASLGRDIPALGKLEGSVRISDRDGSLGIEKADLRVGRAGEFDFRLTGSFDDLRDFEEIAIEAKLESRDLAVIGELVELELPPIGPVSFSGRIRGSAERLRSQGRARLNRTVLEGEWSAVLAPDRRRSLTASIHSPRVFLADIGIEPDADRPELRLGAEGPSAFQRWWSNGEPAPLEPLRDIDLDVTVRADRVSGRGGLEVEDLHAALRLRDGELVIRDAGGSYEGGKVEGRLRVDARPPEPVYELQLEVFNVDLATLASQLEEDTDQVGKVDVSIQLNSRGHTRDEVLANLNGHVGAMLREGSLISRYSRAFSLSFLRISVPELRASREGAASYHCLLGYLPIEDGVATAETFYLEGQKITITGTGQIDLAGNELDLRLTPHLHEPGLVSVAVTVDISGPINDPNLRPLPRSLGASVVGGLFRNVMRPSRVISRRLGAGRRDPQDPCDLIKLRRDQELKTAELESEGDAFAATTDDR